MSISLYNMQQFGGPDAAHSWGARRGSDGEDFLFLRQGGSGDRRVPAVSVFDQQIGRGQSNGLPFAAAGANRADAAGKKTAETIQREVAREVDRLLRVIFNGRRKTGRLDLEAIEMAVRSAMHHAGALALSELLQFPPPP